MTAMGLATNSGDEEQLITAEPRRLQSARRSAVIGAVVFGVAACILLLGVQHHGALPKMEDGESLTNLRGAPNSLTRRPEDLTSFLSCFPYWEKTSENSPIRKSKWKKLDSNKNGLVSLAETGKFVGDELEACLGQDPGHQVYKRFYPIFIIAFLDAADVAKPRVVHAEHQSTTDDYVTIAEFRLLIVYLRFYAEAKIIFEAVDQGLSGDRRISEEEWDQGVDNMHLAAKWSHFRALDSASAEKFAIVDADGKGSVLLSEWCKWLKNEEISANTNMGKQLSAGDD